MEELEVRSGSKPQDPNNPNIRTSIMTTIITIVIIIVVIIMTILITVVIIVVIMNSMKNIPRRNPSTSSLSLVYGHSRAWPLREGRPLGRRRLFLRCRGLDVLV